MVRLPRCAEENKTFLYRRKRIHCRERPHGRAFPLIKLDGICTIDDALKLKNKVLSAKREDIPVKEGRTFICDLIGLDVIDNVTGRVYGKLKDVLQYDPHDIFVIKTSGEDVLMPNVPEYVASVDVDKGIFITPIDGFFD